jgi:hypothetical protein
MEFFYLIFKWTFDQDVVEFLKYSWKCPWKYKSFFIVVVVILTAT